MLKSGIPYHPRVTLRTAAQRDALAGELQALGFSDYEARTYIALLQSSPATAYEVSKIARLPRANTYGALESCTEKGAVQPFSQAPIRYIPVDPRVLLSRIADDTNARCTQLASRLRQIKSDDSHEYVWTIEGEKKVNAKISEMTSRLRRREAGYAGWACTGYLWSAFGNIRTQTWQTRIRAPD